MNSLPPPLGDGGLILWRLDDARHAETWASGEGARRLGGRWNRAGTRCVYACLDPAAAILEVAVHKGFPVLDMVPHVLSRAPILDPASIRVVRAEEVPNPHWLRPGPPSAGQQAFGDALLAAHRFVAIPSVVSAHSWNLIFAPGDGLGPAMQERFALDPRFHPPA